jgi:hypothetical protein
MRQWCSSITADGERVVSGMVGSRFPGGRLQLLHLQATPVVHAWHGNTRELVSESPAARDRDADAVSSGPHALCPATRSVGGPAVAPRHLAYGLSAGRTGRAACSPKLPALHREGTRLT